MLFYSCQIPVTTIAPYLINVGTTLPEDGATVGWVGSGGKPIMSLCFPVLSRVSSQCHSCVVQLGLNLPPVSCDCHVHGSHVVRS